MDVSNSGAWIENPGIDPENEYVIKAAFQVSGGKEGYFISHVEQLDSHAEKDKIGSRQTLYTRRNSI